MFKHTATPAETGPVINLTKLNREHFLALCDSDTTLPKESHRSFLNFIETTTQISEYQKKAFRCDLHYRNITPSDIAFLDLERRYPFAPNSTKTFKPDRPFPSVSHKDICRIFSFYIQYNDQTQDHHLFESGFAEILRNVFPSEADLTPETLRPWFHDTTQIPGIGSIFKTHEQAFISALDHLHYPVEIQDTGAVTI